MLRPNEGAGAGGREVPRPGFFVRPQHRAASFAIPGPTLKASARRRATSTAQRSFERCPLPQSVRLIMHPIAVDGIAYRRRVHSRLKRPLANEVHGTGARCVRTRTNVRSANR